MIGGFIGKAIGEPARTGGTIFIKTIAVTCTTSVALGSKAIHKALSVLSTTSVIQGHRAITKGISVSCLSTVSAARAVARTLVLSCSSATSGIRQAQKALTTSPVVSTVTQVTKSISKGLAVACHTSTSAVWAGIRRRISISTHIKWH